jgi:hypothetical protein
VYVTDFPYVCRAKLNNEDMIDLLVKLICYEYDITKDLLMSRTRVGKVTKALAMMSYILHVDKDIKVSDIYKEYAKRGYKKGRATIYNQIKSGLDVIDASSYSYSLYKGLLDNLDDAKEEKVFTEYDTEFHTILGRIFQKMYNVKRLRHLDSIEKNINEFLETEFLHIGSFDGEEVKFKKDENGEKKL